MNYQAIRAAVENPMLTAFSGLSPSVPVFFDNITAAPVGSVTEYVRVNITFGITNEVTLTSSVDTARGAIIIRVYSVTLPTGAAVMLSKKTGTEGDNPENAVSIGFSTAALIA